MGGINGAMDKRDRNTSIDCLFRFSIATKIIFVYLAKV